MSDVREVRDVCDVRGVCDVRDVRDVCSLRSHYECGFGARSGWWSCWISSARSPRIVRVVGWGELASYDWCDGEV